MSEAKRAVRASMAIRRRAVPVREAQAFADQAAARLLETTAWREAQRVALYAALPDELPTAPLQAAARSAGLAMLWPRVEGARLEFALCGADALVPARFGVRCPPAEIPASNLTAGDLVVVPAVSFTREGGRLGRGGGYYDRVLGSLPMRACSVAIGYDFQLVDELPIEPQDMPVDMVVTNAGIWRRVAA